MLTTKYSIIVQIRGVRGCTTFGTLLDNSLYVFSGTVTAKIIAKIVTMTEIANPAIGPLKPRSKS
jgi:hypothetical protein